MRGAASAAWRPGSCRTLGRIRHGPQFFGIDAEGASDADGRVVLRHAIAIRLKLADGDLGDAADAGDIDLGELLGEPRRLEPVVQYIMYSLNYVKSIARFILHATTSHCAVYRRAQ